MKLRHLLMITTAGVVCIVLSKAYWEMGMEGSKSAKADSTSASESVATVPTQAKFVQVPPVVLEGSLSHEIFVEALGYKEIRVFARIVPADSAVPSIPKKALMKVSFDHELTGTGNRYSTSTFRQETSAYLQGLITEKVYGKKIRVVVDTEDFPEGKYNLYLSYYLLP